jgi:hypothetical protein
MQLSFPSFGTEASYDYVRVYDGPSSASTPLAVYVCGGCSISGLG